MKLCQVVFSFFQQDNMKRALSNASKMQGSVRMISRKPKTLANLEAGHMGPAESGASLAQVGDSFTVRVDIMDISFSMHAFWYLLKETKHL